MRKLDEVKWKLICRQFRYFESSFEDSVQCVQQDTEHRRVCRNVGLFVQFIYRLCVNVFSLLQTQIMSETLGM